MKKTHLGFLFFVALFLWNPSLLYACDHTPTHEFPSDEISVSPHFAQSKELFFQSLNHIQNAELHFFWTTGITASACSQYAPDADVLVGGTQNFGQKFFPYVTALLDNTPDYLKIRFICDEPTQNSNNLALKRLTGLYEKRFFVSHVADVERKLTHDFPEHAAVISHIFTNATRGNAAITSDIYRLIGMLHDPLSLPIQLTYCDVDTFIYGMESDTYTQLIHSLFAQSGFIEDSDSSVSTELKKEKEALKERNAKSFMVWRHRTANDLIKIHLREITPYKSWCRKDILEKIEKKFSLNNRLLNERVILHDNIRTFENISEDQKKAEAFINTCSQNTLTPNDIVYGTGPGFTAEGDHMMMNLSYPHCSTFAWALDIGIEKGQRPLNFIERPKTVLLHDCSVFEQACQSYDNVLKTARLAERFGKKHPFYLYACQWLKDNFPYTTHIESLRAVFWEDFKNNPSLTKDSDKYLFETHKYITHIWSTHYAQIPYYRLLRTSLEHFGIIPPELSLNDLRIPQ